MAASHEDGRRAGRTIVAEALSCLATDIDALTAAGPDELETTACENVLKQVERSIRRLSTLQTRIVGAITERATRAAAEAAENAGRSADVAAGRARRAVEDFLSDELGMAPSDARATTMDGQRRGEHRELDRARDTGDVGPRQARLVAEFLEKLRTSHSVKLSDDELHHVQIGAVAQASRLDPVELGRWLRRRLGQLDARRAELDESTRRRQRTAGFTTTDDGMWRLSATLSGVDAGIATQAIERFRVPDTADIPEGRRRSPGQITADAFVQMCRTALEADATSTTKGGVRPHVVVTIDYQTILDREGVAEIERIGPVPFGEVRRLLADAGVARLLVDPDGRPMEAGPKVRTVPSGLRRALITRDQGCIARRCSIPARWCQVAHLADPFHLGGRLSLDNAALMCHHHHAQFDLHGWQIQWDAHRPQLFPPPSHSASHRIEDPAQLRHADLPPAEPPEAASGRDPTQPPAEAASPARHPKQGRPDPKSDQSAAEPRQLPLLAQESRGTWNPRAGPTEHAVIPAALTGPAARAVYAAADLDEGVATRRSVRRSVAQGVGTSGRQAARVCS